MREDDTVYWVGELSSDQTTHDAHTCICIALLRDNVLLTVDGIAYMDETTQEDLDEMWEEGERRLAAGKDDEDYDMTNLSDSEADKWFARVRKVYSLFAEQEAQEEGEFEYFNDKLLEDNPYSEEDETELWEAWEAGWMAAFARDTGREYDEEREDQLHDKQEREDLRASRAVAARWFHEEINANSSLTVDGFVL